MPYVSVKVIKDVFDADQRQEMIRKFTDTIVEIGSEPLRPYTLVTVEEVDSGFWGVGGQGLTTQDAKNVQATAAATAR